MTITENSQVTEVPLDQIDIGLFQVRTSDVDKGIEELAASIEKMGLLEPIVVSQTEGERYEVIRYEVITGQRRFLAHQYLGRETIRATILKHPVEPEIAKAISLTENMVRQNLSDRDYIDACTELYEKYGSIKAVSEELGLPSRRVSQYVKFEQLIEPLKQEVETGSIRMDVALRAQKAATDFDSKEVNEAAAVVYAEEMRRMSGLQQRQLEKVASEDKSASPEQVIQASRRQPKQINLRVIIGENLHGALQQFTSQEKTDQNSAVTTLLESALSERGYL